MCPLQIWKKEQRRFSLFQVETKELENTDQFVAMSSIGTSHTNIVESCHHFQGVKVAIFFYKILLRASPINRGLQ